MELKDYENSGETFTPANNYKTKLDTLQKQVPPILDDFKKYYVFYNINPENHEYQTLFENIKTNLNTLNSSLFTLSSNVESEIENINTNLVKLDEQIKKEKDKNKDLNKKLGHAEHKNNASNIMISNYKDIYNTGYLRNWALFLSILVVGGTISKIFRRQS
jgi:chromosome segregation ATPase